MNLRIERTEIMSDYYDGIQCLLIGAKHATEDKYTQIRYVGTTYEVSESTINGEMCTRRLK